VIGNPNSKYGAGSGRVTADHPRPMSRGDGKSKQRANAVLAIAFSEHRVCWIARSIDDYHGLVGGDQLAVLQIIDRPIVSRTTVQSIRNFLFESSVSSLQIDHGF
jgi:hypothetical protein